MKTFETQSFEWKLGSGAKDAPLKIHFVPHSGRITDLKLATADEKEALKEALKELKTEVKPEKPIVIRIPRNGRGATVFVQLAAKIEPFFLHEALRKITEADFKALKGNDGWVDVTELDAAHAEVALTAVALLSGYSEWSPQTFGKRAGEEADAKPKKSKKSTLYFRTALPGDRAVKLLMSASLEVAAVNRVRHMADLPSNVLTISAYRKEIEKIAKDLKVQSEFLDRAQLEKMKAGAFLAVLSADPKTAGGIAHLKYLPGGTSASGKNKRSKIALVGKGVIFDTGGYNIKTGNYMYDMHRDMTGSAVALALFELMVKAKVPYEIHLYLALAENLVSPTGYKPNDVVTTLGGISIEIVDTDAEGRVLLSDTLSLASQEKPDLMIDFATLTGACVRAIGTRRSGVFTNRPSLHESLAQVGHDTGERVWPFPVGEDYEDGIKSEVADVRQCADSNLTDHIYAATFLKRFVSSGGAWVHMDLSSECHAGGLGLASSKVTGFGVRYTHEFIHRFFKEGQK